MVEPFGLPRKLPLYDTRGVVLLNYRDLRTYRVHVGRANDASRDCASHDPSSLDGDPRDYGDVAQTGQI